MKELSKDFLDDFIDINNSKDLRIRQIHIYIKGYKTIYHEFMCSHRENLYSGTKTYTSLAIGMAIDDGRLNLDDKIIKFFPEYDDIAKGEIRDIDIKNLLQMNSGKSGMFFNKHEYKTYRDYAEIFFLEGVQNKPGEVFNYNNLNTYMLSRIIEKIYKKTLKEFLEERLFKKLGYFNTQWHNCPNGHTIGLDGLFLRTDEFARLGQLLLQKGVWNGERIISEEYIEAMHKDLMPIEVETDLECSNGYGYQVWKGEYEDSYRADGLHGQFCIVYPSKNAVITTTARQEWRPYEIIENINKYIIEKI